MMIPMIVIMCAIGVLGLTLAPAYIIFEVFFITDALWLWDEMRSAAHVSIHQWLDAYDARVAARAVLETPYMTWSDVAARVPVDPDAVYKRFWDCEGWRRVESGIYT